ncbi:mitochondrial carrier domain-containing protein [Rhodotorula diobovata]|uniref:Mitochondrial carrier domain-containing protein n=1 Tax=Rhodotorula diobovata TaxID=5288 RepID=A0A5C5G1U4_9BASI|nr:mitochondrial carrier domain-containing protein [Rhodotorula diobovata]
MSASAPTASTSSVRLEDSASPALRPPPSDSSSAQPQHPRKRRRTDRDSLSYALKSGLAGGIAGCVAKTSVAPLDRVKILFQTRSPDYHKYAGTFLGVFRASKDIYAETGMRGLLQGHSATLLRIFPYAAIKFMAYDKIHNTLMPTPADETSARRFLAGSTAGIITTGITYPLELIRVRLAFESHHSVKDRASLLRTIRAIYQSPPPVAPSSSSAPAQPPPPAVKPSLTHFYRGVWPTLVGIVPYAGTSFLMWGFLKQDLMPRYLSPSFRHRHRAALDLVAGGVAGAIGQTTAYPLDIVRRRMQVGPVLHADPLRGRAGFWETARAVYAQGGVRNFFVGMTIGYIKVVPMNAVSFAVWVAMKRGLGLDEGRPQRDAEALKDEPEERA